jgi:Protein of unknown function DUF115
MDGVTFPTAHELSQAFLKANLDHLRLGERTRGQIEAAHPLGEVWHQDDGSPVLRHRGCVLGAPSDDLWLSRTVKESGNSSAFVVFGMGFGHTARALRALTDAPVFIYEPEPGLARQTLSCGPSHLGDFPIVCNAHDLIQLWPSGSENRENVTLISTPGYGSLYGREDSALREALTQLVQRRSVNETTHRLRAREWISDVLANVELLLHSPSFLGLAEKYQNVPAFIVGAGPSLGKNGELLADAAKKGIVFAVNSSALALAQRGITPQVLACMESIDLSQLLSRIPYLDQIVRAFSLTAHPNTLRTGQGPLLPVFEGLPQFSPLVSLTHAQGLAVCGSVSTLAFSLAQRLGCSPIVLVGQDLAYTDGQAYATGTPYEGSRVKVSSDGTTLEHERSATLQRTNGRLPSSEPLRRVPGWGGRDAVLSSVGFSAVRDWFEQAADVLQHDRPSQRLINATEGGAHIAGFAELPLSEVLSPLPELGITPDSIIRAARAAQRPLDRKQLRSWFERQLTGARHARHAARRMRRMADAAQRAMGRADPRAIGRAFDKLTGAEHALRRSVGSSPFVDGYSWSEVDAVMREVAVGGNDAHAAAETAVTAGARLAIAIEESTRKLEFELSQHRKTLGAAAP